MIYSIIMAGGIGSRFWPLSRSSAPKQFLSIIGNQSLLEETIDRLNPIIEDSHQTIVTTEVLQPVFPNSIQKRVPTIFWEPEGKNTAPCIGWAAYTLAKKDPEAVCVIVPSDHWISTIEDFTETISDAITEASSHDTIVTIGITPHFPHTGYGYIEVEPTTSIIKPVQTFKEKPDLATAKTYLSQGNYYWNSGMFIAKASTLIKQFEIHLPKHHEILTKLTSDSITEDQEKELYATFDSISIDYGIMEKSAHITRLIPARFNWNDIGSWTALEQFLDKDDHDNAVRGRLLAIESSGNIVYSPKKLVATAHINNMIIVDTDDALLVIPKEHDQKIKDIHKKLDSTYL